jgi:hypothetical protein
MRDEKGSALIHPSPLIPHPFVWWTWHDLNVRPRPSQSRALIPLSYRSEGMKLEVFGATMRNLLAEAAGTEPARDICAAA